MMPTHFLSAASTWGAKTIGLKFGEPISSSHTSTTFTGSVVPAATRFSAWGFGACFTARCA